MFLHHVPPKKPGAVARKVTLTTVVGLSSGVLALVLSHTCSSCALIIALITFEQLLGSFEQHGLSVLLNSVLVLVLTITTRLRN